MRRNNKDLIVGIVIFISLFILITGVLWLKEVSFAQKMVEYTVLFDNIGTLQTGDPVTVNGVKRGVVSKISLYKAKVAVVLKLDKKVVFTDSSKVTIQNIGLMGERMVGIQLSAKGKPYTPNTKDKITYIDGYFDSGIAEAMGMLGSVLGEVLSLVDTVEEIIHHTVGNRQFIDFFNTIVIRLDTIVTLVEGVLEENENEINNTIDNIHIATSDLKELLDSNREKFNVIMEDGTQLTSAAITIADRVDSVASSVNEIISNIKGGKGSIGMLVEDEGVIEDLQETVASLDSLVKDVNENGLKLRAKLLGNRKYFKKKKSK